MINEPREWPAMKPKAFFLAAAVFALILSGCGGGGDHLTLIVQDNISLGGNNDGDITHDPVLATYTVVTNATADNVFVGTSVNSLDPGNPFSDLDSRGYLTFPITQIPLGASIQTARVLVRIDDVVVLSGTSVTILPAMVSFRPLNLLTPLETINLFNDAEILVSTVTYDVFPSRIGTDVSFDVTDAVLEAIRRGDSILQLKLTGSFGRIVIDDTFALAPVLHVEFF